MPEYLFTCDECGNSDRVRAPISSGPPPPQECLKCGSGLLRRDWKAESVHTAPVPGNGTWKYARDLEDKAKRVKTKGGE